MKQQIHAYRGHGEIAVEGHNIKLGRGGIREIEFFVQTQQLIAGGRHPELRGRATVAMLGGARRRRLDRCRGARRSRPRLIGSCAGSSTACRWWPTSRRTRCPPSATALERFARFLGFPSRDEFAGALLSHLRAVQRHYVRLFETRRPARAEQPNTRRFRRRRRRETLDRLRKWASGSRARSRRRCSAGTPAHTARCEGEQARGISPSWCRSSSTSSRASENPDAAFAAFDRFLAGLHAGAPLLLAAAAKSGPHRVSSR